ncbi:MAG TPA: hypothetical protein PKE47_08465, partial [Verrucomicrobiota bacterium]|nr:hypothetical protein [Verrucomicrobiota bacterium]
HLLFSHETRLAFRAMGTNALPFLVDRALDVRPASAARSNLHGLFLRMPKWAGRGSFAPRERQAAWAASLVGEIRPALPVLLPLLEPSLAGTNKHVRSQAVHLLGYATGNLEAAVPHLVRALTQPEDGEWETRLERRRAAAALRQLGSPVAAALPAVAAELSQPVLDLHVESSLLMWLTKLGPSAVAAWPAVEPLLEPPRGPRLVLAALAAHALLPGHPRAVEILRDAAADETPWRQGSSRRSLINYTGICGWPDPLLADLVEPLAAVELETWTPQDFSHSRAMSALEKTAPDRARRLYEAALPTDAGLPAAFRLIQMDSQHRGATETLVHWSRPEAQGLPRLNALSWLGLASPSNELAVAAREAASRRINQPDVEAAKRALEQIVEARARAAPPAAAE